VKLPLVLGIVIPVAVFSLAWILWMCMYCSLHRKVQKAQKEPVKKEESRLNDDGWVMVEARGAVSSSAVNEPLRPPRAELEATTIREDPPGHDDGVRVEASMRTDNHHREGHYGNSYVEIGHSEVRNEKAPLATSVSRQSFRGNTYLNNRS